MFVRVSVDPLFKQHLLKAEAEMQKHRYWILNPHKPFQVRPVMLLYCRDVLGITSKEFVRHVMPIFGPQNNEEAITDIWGKDKSPIDLLGDIPVLMFIRYMLFERGWSQEAATQLLVDKLGYPYNNARPLIRRVIRNEQAQRERWEAESHKENSAANLRVMQDVAERRHAS